MKKGGERLKIFQACVISHVQAKNTELIQTESRMVVAKGRGGENVERLVKGYKRPVMSKF